MSKRWGVMVLPSDEWQRQLQESKVLAVEAMVARAEEEWLERERFGRIINAFRYYGTNMHERMNRTERQLDLSQITNRVFFLNSFLTLIRFRNVLIIIKRYYRPLSMTAFICLKTKNMEMYVKINFFILQN
ncbi:hypothetical protein llap_14848 [Limosa lapponica baueri]|uniref:Uncharacterized protein n=1 Tax=Limosa lapponica baueri TaxID=1758121 RepID=A0A2I0TM63_LIMLA|nr:hypothetical protein llap_14848 [Limosa lapponica baueri]